MKEWYHGNGSSVDICVMKTAKRFSRGICSNAETLTAPHHIETDVAAGDILRFITGRCDAEKQSRPLGAGANIIGWVTKIAYGGQDAEKGDYRLAKIGADGDSFEYAVPVSPDVYAVRLSFTEPVYKWSGERSMKVKINGVLYENDLDLIHVTRGNGKPFSKIYNYIVPDADGNIKVTLTSDKGGCAPGAVGDTPARRRRARQLRRRRIYRWSGSSGKPTNTLPEANQYTRSAANSGRRLRPLATSHSISRTRGHGLSYSIPVKKICSVSSFAELDGTAGRLFDIYINGVMVSENRDALAAAANSMTADMRFDDIQPTAIKSISSSRNHSFRPFSAPSKSTDFPNKLR